MMSVEGIGQGAATVALQNSGKSEQQRSDDADKIEVARQFEAIFVRQLLGQMQVESSGGAGQEMYQGMSNEAMANHITEHSEGFGIAHSLLKHWGVKPAP